MNVVICGALLLKVACINKHNCVIYRQVGVLKQQCSDRCWIEGTEGRIEPLYYLRVCERLHLSVEVLYRD